MLNLSDLITSIKMDLGIYGLALPFENPDKTLYDVLKLKTIITFSLFQPQKATFTFNLAELKCIKGDYKLSTYEIPNVFGDRTILYISDVRARDRLMGSGIVSPLFDADPNLYQGLALGQAQANLMSAAAPAQTFKFEAPNLLHLYNYATSFGEVDIEFALSHAPNLTTVTPTSWESFYELASLDIKRFLYNTIKHYTEIQTAYGSISLKIDDWSGAEQDRKDLIEKWKDTYHLDEKQFIII